MTDYNKWSSFDHDAALDEVDTRATFEAATDAQKRNFQENAKRSEDNLVNAKMQVEILQSKTAVEALKAKGTSGRRSRKKNGLIDTDITGADTAVAGGVANEITSISSIGASAIESVRVSEDSVGTVVKSSLDPEISSQMELTSMLTSISDFLFSLLRDVEQMRVLTEKKTSHAAGYSMAVRAFLNIGVFSKIKNETILQAIEVKALKKCSSSSAGATAAVATAAAVNSVSLLPASASLSESEGHTTMPLMAPQDNTSVNAIAAAAADDDDDDEGAADATATIIEDLNNSEDFLLVQSAVFMSLFALTLRESAVAADMSRFALAVRGNSADAGVWVLRGLAFAAMGIPYLALVHFGTAQSYNAQYSGLEDSGLIGKLEEMCTIHAIWSSSTSRREKIVFEVMKMLNNTFVSDAEAPSTIQKPADLSMVDEHVLKSYMGSFYLKYVQTIGADKMSCIAAIAAQKKKVSATASVQQDGCCEIHMEEVVVDEGGGGKRIPKSIADEEQSSVNSNIDIDRSVLLSIASHGSITINERWLLYRQQLQSFAELHLSRSDATMLHQQQQQQQAVRTPDVNCIDFIRFAMQEQLLCSTVSGGQEVDLSASLLALYIYGCVEISRASNGPAAVAFTGDSFKQFAKGKSDIPVSPFHNLYKSLQLHNSTSSSGGSSLEPSLQWAIVVLLDMTRRLFYEAQMLFLENVFSSAESKYCSVLLYASSFSWLVASSTCSRSDTIVFSATGDVRSSSNKHVSVSIESIAEHMELLTSTCLLNISMCRVHEKSVSSSLSSSSRTTTTSSTSPPTSLSSSSSLSSSRTAEAGKQTTTTTTVEAPLQTTHCALSVLQVPLKDMSARMLAGDVGGASCMLDLMLGDRALDLQTEQRLDGKESISLSSPLASLGAGIRIAFALEKANRLVEARNELTTLLGTVSSHIKHHRNQSKPKSSDSNALTELLGPFEFSGLDLDPCCSVESMSYSGRFPLVQRYTPGFRLRDILLPKGDDLGGALNNSNATTKVVLEDKSGPSLVVLEKWRSCLIKRLKHVEFQMFKSCGQSSIVG